MQSGRIDRGDRHRGRYGHSLALGQALVKHAVSDFDQDGKPDLLWHNQATGQLVYWLLDGVRFKPGGNGSLTPSVVNPVWKVVGTPDLDGDGNPDLLWHNQTTGQLVYWLLDGVQAQARRQRPPHSFRDEPGLAGGGHA